jgi:Uma2 family endonuclease
MATAVHQPDLQHLTPADPGELSDGQNDGRAVTLDQYLTSSYSPDCDLVDGPLEERNMGEFDHGKLQAEIAFFFRLHESEWKTNVVVETRLQTRPASFRVPDVMVLRPGQKPTQIIREAPLLCIEILSPGDTWKRIKVRVDEYIDLGVQHVWAFDPTDRTAYRCDRDGFHRVTTPDLAIPGTPITLNLPSLFAVLDSGTSSSA